MNAVKPHYSTIHADVMACHTGTPEVMKLKWGLDEEE
jgi:hypothetical protein